MISIYRVTIGWLLSAGDRGAHRCADRTFRPVQALLEPLTDFIRTCRAVAFIPLVMLWIGIDEGSKNRHHLHRHVLSNDPDGGGRRLRRVPTTQIEAAQTMGATARRSSSSCCCPRRNRRWSTTLRITMGWPWSISWWPSWSRPNSGLGYAILKAQRFLQERTRSLPASSSSAIGLSSTDQLFRWAHRPRFHGCI